MAKVVNPRAIKRKIRSVQNLKKITKAMEMVSAAKLKKVQGRLLAIRPYSDKLRELYGKRRAFKPLFDLLSKMRARAAGAEKRDLTIEMAKLGHQPLVARCPSPETGHPVMPSDSTLAAAPH